MNNDSKFHTDLVFTQHNDVLQMSDDSPLISIFLQSVNFTIYTESINLLTGILFTLHH